MGRRPARRHHTCRAIILCECARGWASGSNPLVGLGGGQRVSRKQQAVAAVKQEQEVEVHAW